MPETLPSDFLWLYFALPAVLIGPATMLMGFGFPLMQRVVQTDLAHLGRRVGAVLVANIVGSAMGAVVTGWLLLTWLARGHAQVARRGVRSLSAPGRDSGRLVPSHSVHRIRGGCGCCLRRRGDSAEREWALGATARHQRARDHLC